MEALKIIASAWSCFFVVAAFLATTCPIPVNPVLLIALYVFAVTGAGWLWHRANVWAERRIEPEETSND